MGQIRGGASSFEIEHVAIGGGPHPIFYGSLIVIGTQLEALPPAAVDPDPVERGPTRCLGLRFGLEDSAQFELLTLDGVVFVLQGRHRIGVADGAGTAAEFTE